MPLQKEYRKELVLLRLVLEKHGFDSQDFSLNGYAEMKVCLSKEKSGWEVFVGERGNKYCLTTHTDLESACLQVIDELSDEENSAKIKQKYLAALSYSKIRKSYVKVAHNSYPNNKINKVVGFASRKSAFHVNHSAGNQKNNVLFEKENSQIKGYKSKKVKPMRKKVR